MKSMDFNGFTLDYHESINVYVNEANRKVIFISKNDDEIHGVLQLDERNKVKIYPRWNTNFIVEGTKITIGVNYEDEIL